MRASVGAPRALSLVVVVSHLFIEVQHAVLDHCRRSAAAEEEAYAKTGGGSSDTKTTNNPIGSQGKKLATTCKA